MQKAPNLGRFKKDLEKKNKIFMIIAEIPKANYCSFFCFLLTMDECIINVWGYTEILPIKRVLLVNQNRGNILNE